MVTGRPQLAPEAADLLLEAQSAYGLWQQSMMSVAQWKAAGATAEELTNLQTNLMAAEQNLAQRVDALKGYDERLAALAPGADTTIEPQFLQAQLLDEQTTLIEYFVPDPRLERLIEMPVTALVINKAGMELVSLPSTSTEIANEVEYFRGLLDKNIDLSETNQKAAELHAKLMAPLQPYIQHKNLIIVPHGVLHYLPFAALRDGATDRYLIADYTITYVPSASVMPILLDNRNPNHHRLLALGNPDTSLDYAEQEVSQIASLYGTIPLLQAQATEQQIHEQAARFDVLHLAAHGNLQTYEPLQSHMVLAPSDSADGQACSDGRCDGKLTVREVYGLNLADTNLVVLSACKTDLGAQSAGDEIIGLTRAFLYAGTPTVITTLWNIEDETSAQLMKSFHQTWLEGLPTAHALRQAQLETMRSHPHPYYWAAFVLHGDGSVGGKN